MTRDEKISFIIELLNKNYTMKEIGKELGDISRQRVYQLLTQFNIETKERKKKGFWKNQSIPNKWLWRVLNSKPISWELKWNLFNSLSSSLPSHCPMLDIK